MVSTLKKFLESQQIRFQVLATTGIAARIAGGMTIHSFFGLTTRLHLKMDRMSLQADVIKNLQVLIIDEVSMLDLRLFLKIDAIMRSYQTHEKRMNLSFGGRNIILIADPAQLLVVKGESIFSHPLFEKFKVFNLKEIVRQKDMEFDSYLNEIRKEKFQTW